MLKAGSPARVGLLAAILLSFALGWLRSPDYRYSDFATPGARVFAVSEQEPRFESRFVSSSVDDFVHSASLAPLPGGDLIAVWFAGSREGAADVEIRSALFDAQSGEWGPETVLIDRLGAQAGLQRHIRKLGNPVIALAPDDRLWLFFVTASVGGWSLSSVNATFSDDGGKSWSVPRRLVTSPFFNLSTLVRSAPVFHRDGSIGLPVYHEFIGKFAEYLYMDRDGRILDKFRISKGRSTLQPTVVALDGRTGIAMMRYFGTLPGKVYVSRTEDAGRTWSEAVPVEMHNPNSSLSAVATRSSSRRLLVALNDLGIGRFRLSLFRVDPALRRWQPLTVLDEPPGGSGDSVERDRYRLLVEHKFLGTAGTRHRPLVASYLEHIDERTCTSTACWFEFEYPYLLQGRDGRFHVVYSWNNSFVKHVTFNMAWLDTLK